jgi:hypothetical protein
MFFYFFHSSINIKSYIFLSIFFFFKLFHSSINIKRHTNKFTICSLNTFFFCVLIFFLYFIVLISFFYFIILIFFFFLIQRIFFVLFLIPHIQGFYNFTMNLISDIYHVSILLFIIIFYLFVNFTILFRIISFNCIRQSFMFQYLFISIVFNHFYSINSA